MCVLICVHIHVTWRGSWEGIISDEVKKLIKDLIMEGLYSMLNFAFKEFRFCLEDLNEPHNDFKQESNRITFILFILHFMASPFCVPHIYSQQT